MSVFSPSTSSLTNPIKFSYYSTAAQNSGNGAFAQTLFATKDYDTGSNVASSTFTAPIACFMHFDWVTVSNAGATVWIASVFKNGAEFRRGTQFGGVTAANIGSNGSTDIQLAVSDTVDIRTFGNAAVAINVSQATCAFTGHEISST